MISQVTIIAMTLSIHVNNRLVPMTAFQMFTPEAIKVAANRESAELITPPNNKTAIGADVIVDTNDVTNIVITSFHHVSNIFARARKPATRPTAMLVSANGIALGLVMPSTRLPIKPVRAPTHGPQSIETKNVPIVSRKSGRDRA